MVSVDFQQVPARLFTIPSATFAVMDDGALLTWGSGQVTGGQAPNDNLRPTPRARADRRGRGRRLGGPRFLLRPPQGRDGEVLGRRRRGRAWRRQPRGSPGDGARAGGRGAERRRAPRRRPQPERDGGPLGTCLCRAELGQGHVLGRQRSSSPRLVRPRFRSSRGGSQQRFRGVLGRLYREVIRLCARTNRLSRLLGRQPVWPARPRDDQQWAASIPAHTSWATAPTKR
jgi:hypothetical protein